MADQRPDGSAVRETGALTQSTDHATRPAERDWILHVDLDEFLAAVEINRRPELRGKPVVVGGAGDPTQRAVVATAPWSSAPDKT